MILEKIVFVMLLLVLIGLLCYKLFKCYEFQNIFMIGTILISLGSYLPFAINKVYIPRNIQLIIFFVGIIIPSIYLVIQYNDIKIVTKLLYKKINKLYKLKNYTKAIENTKKLIKLEGYTSKNAELLGNCYSSLHDNNLAQDFYEISINLDKHNATSYLHLAKIKELINSKKEAINLYIEAIKYDEKLYEAYEGLAILLTNLGIYKYALEVYEKALSFYPNSYELLYNMAMLEYRLHFYDEAIHHFTKAINLDKTLYGAYLSLGNIYLIKNDLESAIICFKNLINVSTYAVFAYYNLALIYCKKENYDVSFAILEYAMESDSHYINEAEKNSILAPLKDRIKKYKIQKEKQKLKDYTKRNFKNVELKLYSAPKESSPSLDNVDIKNNA